MENRLEEMERNAIIVKDHDTLLDMCPHIDPLIGCFGCDASDEIWGRQLSCRVEEKYFDCGMPEECKSE